MWFYNSFIESNGMTSKNTLTDSLTFSLSNITAQASIDILSNVLNFSYDGLSGMLAEPLFTGFLYMYLYNYFIRYSNLNNAYNKRDNNKNFMIGAGVNLLVKWF